MGTVNPDQLEAEADALLKQLKGEPAPAPAPKADSAPPPQAPEVPPQPQAQPEPPVQEQPPATQAPPTPAQPGSELQSLQDRLTNTQAAFHAKCQENAELNRQLDTLQAQVQQIQQQAQQPPQQATTPAEPDHLATIREDYGDDLAQALQAQRQSMQRELDAFKAQYQQQQEQVTAQQHMAAIEARHPDAQQIATSQAFNNWLIGQPPFVQAVIQSGTSADVIAVLDQFKAQQGTAPSRLETAKKVADPNVRANPTSPNPQSQPMRADVFLDQQPKGWLDNPENEAKFDELMRSGQLTLS